MATVKVGQANFGELVAGNDIVLADFWASWCAPCRAFGPVFEKASEKYPDIVFAKVDTEAEQQLAGALGISSIPTLMVFREQVLLYAQPGALPAAALDQLVQRVLGLDMEQVHRELAADREKSAAGRP